MATCLVAHRMVEADARADASAEDLARGRKERRRHAMVTRLVDEGADGGRGRARVAAPSRNTRTRGSASPTRGSWVCGARHPLRAPQRTGAAPFIGRGSRDQLVVADIRRTTSSWVRSSVM